MDFYQLTMTYAYWKNNSLSKEGVFNLYYRDNPFSGGFVVFAGLSYAIDLLESFKPSDEDIAYLNSIRDENGDRFFSKEFLDYLLDFRFSCDILSMPEGTIVFPNEPILRVNGPIFQCLLIESLIINTIGFQSLVATKACRLRLAVGSDSLLEFGLRRSQGIDGSLCASRAAYIGGCDATSNVLAAKMFGIRPAGTHSHNWVMSYGSEIESFYEYAHALPNSCIFLVDTYDTLRGVNSAIKVAKSMKECNKLKAIRLDSGDLAYLSAESRNMLDQSGLDYVKIVATNDLDEYIIKNLKNEQGSRIDTWGVGTKLITSDKDPSLSIVYKLSAFRNSHSKDWSYTMKTSDDTSKISTPGIQRVRRFYKNNRAIGDMIYNELDTLEDRVSIIDPVDSIRKKEFFNSHSHKDLLINLFENGRCIYNRPSIHTIKKKVVEEIATLDDSIKRFSNPHRYPVGLEKKLYKLRRQIMISIKE